MKGCVLARLIGDGMTFRFACSLAAAAAAGLALAAFSPAAAQEPRVAPAPRAVVPPAAAKASKPAMPAAAKPKPAAAASVQPDTPSYSASIDSVITVHADRTAESTSTRRLKVLGEAALQSVGQQSYSYIEGMQDLQILEAYTEKANGQRIDVDPATVITRDEASGLAAVYLRDAKTRTVIFPDLAVDDSIVLVTRTRTLSGVFPGHYTYQYVFARQIAFADSRIEVVAPKELPLNVAALGSGIEHRRSEDADLVRHVLTYRATPRSAEEPGATSALDRDPRVFVSTFRNYAELGEAYWAQAAKRVTAAPEIRALADEITAGIADRRAQAEAIDRWVKRNIRYVAIYLGAGRVVPNDAASVLKNKYGDCKDQVTFMSALLAAKGIASEQVLVNSGNAYALDEPATLASLNHVMLYLPEFGIYDDPTASFSAFGVLGGEYDKPAVHVSAAGARMSRTPAMRSEDHTSISQTRVTIAANGTVSGETKQISTGLFAGVSRTIAAAIQNNGAETVAERQLQSFGTPGKGRYDVESPSNFAEPYVVKGRFTLNDRITMPSTARRPLPIGIPILGRPGEFLFGSRVQGRSTPFSCYAGRQVEELEVTFPEGMPLHNSLQDRRIDNRLFTYKSESRFAGRTLRIRHEFVSRVPGQVCPPETETQIGRQLTEVRASVLSRPVISPSVVPAAQKKPPDSGLGSFFRRN